MLNPVKFIPETFSGLPNHPEKDSGISVEAGSMTFRLFTGFDAVTFRCVLARPRPSAHYWRHFFDVQSNHPEYAFRALSLVRLLFLNEKCARDTVLFKLRKCFRTMSKLMAEKYFDLCLDLSVLSVQPIVA